MAQKNPLGPVGRTVQQNVKRLREGQNLSLAELSRRLERTGRRVPVLGLTRIEAGERRVDADDLVALAAALNVSPVTLLLPAEDPQQPVELAEDGLTAPTWDAAWRWMHGERPIASDSRSPAHWASQAQWLAQNRPYLAEEEAQRDMFTPPDPVPSKVLEEEDDGEGMD